MPSYSPDSTHDEPLARCHTDRGNRVGADTPTQSSLRDCEPAARCTDSDMAGFQRCVPAEDSAVLTRTHAIGRRRSSVFDECGVPKLMSSLDYEPAARCIDSDMAGFQRCVSAEDSAVLARTHATGRRRSSMFDECDVPKLVSSLDSCSVAHDGDKHPAFTPLPANAASAASTPTSASLDDFLSSTLGRLASGTM